MICNLDCFNCKFNDCINDEIYYSDIVRSEKLDKHASGCSGKSLSNSAYYLENREKILEQRRQYYIKNRNRLLVEKKIWREENKDRIRKYNRNYYLKNKEKIQMRMFEYRAKRKLAQVESKKGG